MLLKSQNTWAEDIEVPAGTSLVGRAARNSIVLGADFVSGTHARLVNENGMLTVEDMGSTNGTFINGHQIPENEQIQLQTGMSLAFGDKDEGFLVEIIVPAQPKVDDTKTQVSQSTSLGGSKTQVASAQAMPAAKPSSAGSQGTKVFTAKSEFTIGRSLTNDIAIDSPVVSSLHLKIDRAADGSWHARDNNSTNGTYLNSPHNRMNEFRLEPGQTIYVGSYKLLSDRILSVLKADSVEKVGRIKVSQDNVIIGRNPDADVYVAHPSVSWRHAKLTKSGENYVIEDLGSTNGTYVNGVLIKNPTQLRKNDEILLGIYAFSIDFDSSDKVTSLVKKTTLDGLTLEAKNITKLVGKDIALLDDISLTVNPGEFVGLMGLSGAGKTTFLKALNGYDKPTRGSSYINGMDIYEHYNLFKTMIGYVPQDDIVHPELTVYEALDYYAKLRLPSDMKKGEIKRLIKDTLAKLGLAGVENTVIGSPDTEKGISGGQRKRVNLAMELLADPKIIFLDEPTSGLSAVDTKMVMELLRQLADEGKTIIITIHQPSFDNYKIMDSQIILSYGKLAYYGPTYPNSIKFFNPGNDDPSLLNNPDNALIGLNEGEAGAGEDKLDPRKDRNRKGKYWQQRYLQSPEHQDYVTKRQGLAKNLEGGQKQSASSIKQLFILAGRFIRVKLKDRVNTTILLAQAPLIAVMVSLLFSEEAYLGDANRPGMAFTLMFVLAIAAVWFGNTNASREIVAERAIYERERMVGIKILPYVFSKFIVLAPLCAIQTGLLVGITYFATPFELGFENEIWWVSLLVFLTSLAGLSIGLLVSAFSKSQSQALALIPIVLLPMIIFGGGMMTVKQMYESDGKVAFYIAQAIPTRWALEEMTAIYDAETDHEAFCKERIDETLHESEAMTNCLAMRNLTERNYGEAATNRETVLGVLGGFIVIPLLFVIFILRRRDHA
ncbi:MAG: ABC-type efflux pump hybrid permease / ATPase [Idiomarinaceae bacterium HL-53]|nr:MAG: ABC-type efflux pump hybrid permease / ATPase [Idiomarinaceae bacterium HL-53]CUS49000.1 FHA modulated ABC efflux pump with fused ATPase and integral membrane subunits [Idiomarinaceae bacterium HL-53]